MVPGPRSRRAFFLVLSWSTGHVRTGTASIRARRAISRKLHLGSEETAALAGAPAVERTVSAISLSFWAIHAIGAAIAAPSPIVGVAQGTCHAWAMAPTTNAPPPPAQVRRGRAHQRPLVHDGHRRHPLHRGHRCVLRVVQHRRRGQGRPPPPPPRRRGEPRTRPVPGDSPPAAPRDRSGRAAAGPGAPRGRRARRALRAAGGSPPLPWRHRRPARGAALAEDGRAGARPRGPATHRARGGRARPGPPLPPLPAGPGRRP